MLKIIKRNLVQILNNLGYIIIKKQHVFAKYNENNWLQKLNIDTIIDIGSNEGQFIEMINGFLPNRKIFAFEPIKAVYEKLLTNTKHLNVQAFNYGLSDHNGSSEINISANTVSSSLLKMESLHEKLYSESQYTSKETIQLRKLDDIVKDLDVKKNILIKIDVQGYEDKVIAGGTNVLKRATVIIVESSFESLYERQWLFDKILAYFTSSGFRFVGFSEQILSKKTALPLFGDAIFIREDLVKSLY